MQPQNWHANQARDEHPQRSLDLLDLLCLAGVHRSVGEHVLFCAVDRCPPLPLSPLSFVRRRTRDKRSPIQDGRSPIQDKRSHIPLCGAPGDRLSWNGDRVFFVQRCTRNKRSPRRVIAYRGFRAVQPGGELRGSSATLHNKGYSNLSFNRRGVDKAKLSEGFFPTPSYFQPHNYKTNPTTTGEPHNYR